MRKSFVVLMTTGLVLAGSGVAMADITPKTYDITGMTYDETSQGQVVATGFSHNDTSVHPYGTWNSPYTLGVDGYNYNDAQQYTDTGTQDSSSQHRYSSGPHGGYLTSTHRCRECHAVHRAAGKFKLTRGDSRYEACDWCHGTGAGSGFNIQMDNDADYTTEYNVGHTMGYGISGGKWKAPDDTFPAFTPNYYMGGFSCFDCHSPHANPSRLLGYSDTGTAVGLSQNNKVFGILNPGHGETEGDPAAYISGGHAQPIYLSGSWLLIKNPDREIAVADDTKSASYTIYSGTGSTAGVEITSMVDSITAGSEISDGIMQALYQYDSTTSYPVNKIPIDWNDPIGQAGSATTGQENRGYTQTGTQNIWAMSEFCTDCHDGNAGLHTVQAPLFSEDRALRTQGFETETPAWKGEYDLAYGHDAQPRHCKRQMRFNPEDGTDFGPHCRSCHRGSSACNTCHNGEYASIGNPSRSATGLGSMFDPRWVSTAIVYDSLDSTPTNYESTQTNETEQIKFSRDVTWPTDWRTTSSIASAVCADDGFSWPHRTLGYMLLKDDLFGLDIDGSTPIAAGQTRSTTSSLGDEFSDNYKTDVGINFVAGREAHDIDSVCLDCHNPTIWNATSTSNHTDTAGSSADNYNDELILRGLP
ncbi:MAG: hypothetical protein K6T91_11040 [Firmicutes bacterium]|nr:hypothetical protein [Bacillota bacterium]